MELWGRYCAGDGKAHQWAAWKAAWKFGWQLLTQEMKPVAGWERVGNDCVECLRRFLETARESNLDYEELSNLLEIIEPPQGLTPQKQAEWEELWMKLLAPSDDAPDDSNLAGCAAIHLLKLADAGVTSQERVKEAILARLGAGSSSWPVGYLRQRIKTWEQERHTVPEVFYDVCPCLRQSVRWADPEFRLAVVKALLPCPGADCLEADWRQETESPAMVPFWLNILREESDPEIITYLGKWESFRRKIKSGRNRLTDAFRQSAEIWEKWAASDQPQIRQAAWKVLHQVEDGVEILLMKNLSMERNPEVLLVMADWSPSPEKPLPHGFWKEWGQSLQEVWILHEKTMDPAGIVSMAEKIGRLFVTTGSADEPGATDWWKENLTGLQDFWNQLTTTFPDKRIRQLSRDKYRLFKVLFALDEPPEKFQCQLSEIKAYEFKDLMASLKAVGLCDRRERPLTSNMIRNLGLVAVSTLSNSHMWWEDVWGVNTWSLTKGMLVNIWNHGGWGPDEIPVGWDRFCELLQKEINRDEINLTRLFQLDQIGREIKEPRCQRVSLEMMQEMQQSGNASILLMGEQIFWHEVVTRCKKTKEDCPDGRKTDWQTEWRQLRQFIHLYPAATDGQSGQPEIRGTGRGRKSKSFRNELWEKLKLTVGQHQPETESRKTARQKSEENVRLKEKKCLFL